MVIGVDSGGLSGGETQAIVERFIEQTGVTFPVGWDLNNSYQNFGSGGSGLSPFPYDVIIDQEGRVAYVSREFDPTAMQQVIERLIP